MKAKQPRWSWDLPVVLIAGFLVGALLFTGHSLYTPDHQEQKQPNIKSSEIQSGSVFTSVSTSKRNAAAKGPGKSSQEKTFRWDEASIQALNVNEVKKRLKEMAQWPPSPETERIEKWLVRRWALFEPREACQFAYQEVVQGADTSLLEEPLRIWAETSSGQAASWAGSLGSPSLRDIAIRIAFRIWADKDPTAAAQGAARLPSAVARTAATVAVAPPQARKNFTAAMEWARGLPGSKKQKTLEEILGEWTKRDPAKAATWLIQQPGDVQWSLVAKLAADWVRKDPATALGWGLGSKVGLEVGSDLAAGPVQRKFMEAAIGNLIAADPEAAAIWLTTPAGQPYLESRAASLAARWATLDPVDATTWSMGLADSGMREAAMQAVAGTWGRIDPQEAGSWIRSLPPSRESDLALKAYCTAIANYDAPLAAVWANSISDPGTREAAITAVFKQWEKINSSAARDFILQNDQLSPSARDRILK